MRTITFDERARDQFMKARDLIANMRLKDEDAANKMQDSFDHGIKLLVHMLMSPAVAMENEYKLEMHPDFVDGSFAFVFSLNGNKDFNGGLILHGLQETYSVSLNSSPYPYWSIHT